MAVAKKAKTQEMMANVPSLVLKELELMLVGDTPLIVHAWSKKAKEEILLKQQKKQKGPKEVRDPQKDYEESLYHHPDGGYGFPSIAFKSAAVTVCTQIEGVTKVFARQTFHVQGDMVRIYGEPRMREDMVRIGMGTADLRYRAEFPEWHAILTIQYNSGVISEEQLRNMFSTAGFGVGIGEWRPERDGNFGRFHVASPAEEEERRIAQS